MPTCRWRAKTPSRPIRGRTSSTDAGAPTATSATAKPIGASAASSVQTQTMKRRCIPGRRRNAIHSRAAELA